VRTFAFLLASLLVGVSPKAVAAPAISIFIYAPVQADSPLHVVGFQYDEGFIKLALLNASDKSIVGVEIIGLEQAPPGCAPEPRRVVDIGASVEPLRIAPHERVVTSGRGDHPGLSAGNLVLEAQHWEAASLQLQVGVWEVDFADGTKWRPQRELPRAPFDPSLVEADAGKCPGGVAATTKALTAVVGVKFDHSVERPSTGGENGTLPRLVFSCSLEGSKAVCPI
jgi:hypothetical protein